MEMFSNPIGLAAGLSLCAHAKAVHHQPQAMISFRLVPTLANGKPIRGVRPFELIGTPNSDLITSLDVPGYQLCFGQQLRFPRVSGLVAPLYYEPAETAQELSVAGLD